jgi:hypothetical protein
MPAIRPIDVRTLDRIFKMESGHVLDFTRRTLSEFFATEFNIDIDDATFSDDGSSKGKRLKCFLRKVKPELAAKVIEKLWEYREQVRMMESRDEDVPNAYALVLDIVRRLGGQMPPPSRPFYEPPPAVDFTAFDHYANELIALWEEAPQRRGIRFEDYLKRLFHAHGFGARGGFRVVGEQIDGSFVFQNQTYLLEAKWHQHKTDAADLRSFSGKIGERMTWTRGLFVSYAGFTREGLSAFGRGKSLICMSGQDISEAMQRQITLDKVFNAKLRHADETGEIYAEVRELF